MEPYLCMFFFMFLNVLNSKKAKLKKSYREKVLKIAETKKKLKKHHFFDIISINIDVTKK